MNKSANQKSANQSASQSPDLQISKSKAWVMAARPKTLPAALGPVLVGVALAIADGAFRFSPAVAASLGALLLQIGANFANDYFDHFKGADTIERLGPTRVTASGLITPAELRAGMVAIFGLAALVGVYLVYVGGWPIVAIGVASILGALLYTGGPFPFGYHGLGDFFVFVFFGLVAVGGTYYVQALTIEPVVLLAAVPIGALITNILVVNNYRDIETDDRADKRTLAVMIGRKWTRVEYAALLIVAHLTPLFMWIGLGWRPWIMLPWLAIPLTIPLLRTLFSAIDGPTLNATLAGTARHSLIFSLLFALGIVLG